MSAVCFSSECGLCSTCCGPLEDHSIARSGLQDYITPAEMYEMETGLIPPRESLPIDTWGLYQGMLYTSMEYRWSGNNIYHKWNMIIRLLKRRDHYFRLYDNGGVMDQIKESNIDFLKGCTEESVVYGKGRSLKPETYMIHMAIQYGNIDINKVGGKVSCSGGVLFDLDTMRKCMNLGNEEYEKNFDKFGEYITKIHTKMEEYGVKLDQGYQGAIPEVILYGDEEYTFTKDKRAMCDEPECCLMTHCMVNWDEMKTGNLQSCAMKCYTGNMEPEHDSYYYGQLIGKIPKYTQNMKHELCILCILKNGGVPSK